MQDCGHLVWRILQTAMEWIGRILLLDYGPCGETRLQIPLFTSPICSYQKLKIPRKMSAMCFFGANRDSVFFCKKDEKKWGRCGRGLDWGALGGLIPFILSCRTQGNIPGPCGILCGKMILFFLSWIPENQSRIIHAGGEGWFCILEGDRCKKN